MKKLTAAMLAAGVLAGGMVVSAANGDFVGYIYSTDILATVDGIPVVSYCLDGKTAVAVRDLEPLGFSVNFFENARIATLETPLTSLDAAEAAEVERGTVGEIIGTIVESDITLFVNGTEAPCYNIGGRLVAAIEDLAPVDHNSSLTEAGYSETELAHAWDEETRTIALYTLAGADNRKEAEQIAADNNLCLAVAGDDGRITLENNAYPEFSGTEIKAGISNRYEPLYYIAADGTRTEAGFAYRPKTTVVSRQYTYNGEFREEILFGDPEYLMSDEVYTVNSAYSGGDGVFSFDLDAIKAICEENSGVHATIEEEVAYWQAGGPAWWSVEAKFETEEYVLLATRIGGLSHGGPYYRALRLDREPRRTVQISDEWMSGAELYDNTLYYFSGSGLYAQDVYETEAELVCEATDENIDAYLREHWQVLYEAEDEAARVYVLEGDGGYRIYYVGTEYGVRVIYLDEVDELYAYETRIVYTNGDESKYVQSGYEYGTAEVADDAAEVREKGTRVLP